MRLEDIRSTYGMHDYYDNIGMKIYQLSNVIDSGKGDLLVPVQDVFTNQIIGYAHMDK